MYLTTVHAPLLIIFHCLRQHYELSTLVAVRVLSKVSEGSKKEEGGSGMKDVETVVKPTSQWVEVARCVTPGPFAAIIGLVLPEAQCRLKASCFLARALHMLSYTTTT